MILVDGMEVGPASIVAVVPNPKFDDSKPEGDDNPTLIQAELEGVQIVCSVHGGSGEFGFIFPKRHATEVLKALREVIGADIRPATAEALSKLPPAPGANGAAS